MNTQDPLSELLRRLQQFAPDFQQLGEGARAQLRDALEKALNELGVLTADEFAAQQHSLERAEQRIAALEQTVARLEQELTSTKD